MVKYGCPVICFKTAKTNPELSPQSSTQKGKAFRLQIDLHDSKNSVAEHADTVPYDHADILSQIGPADRHIIHKRQLQGAGGVRSTRCREPKTQGHFGVI